jgi:hypothetical protein
MGDSAPDAMDQLRTAFRQSWPSLATAVDQFTFPEDANPTPLLQSIHSTTDHSEKAMFCALLDCFDLRVSSLAAILAERETQVAEYDSDLTRSEKVCNDLRAQLAESQQSCVNKQQALEARSAEIANLNSKVTELNTQQSAENIRVAQFNERISKLQDEKSELQARVYAATNGVQLPQVAISSSKPRRTTTNPDKFGGGQQDTAKRQSAYERWKTQITQILVVDADCFPTAIEVLTFITSQLTGKAWDAVQDGVQKMNTNPKNPETWTWPTVTALWKTLDSRYILLDSTQAAKNTLDTLFQEKRAYGDFKADFDHYADKAKLDDRTKVDMLRKRLSKAITNVINNQITLPEADDYTSWTKITDSIARNLQQQEHIAKLQSMNNPRAPEAPAPQAPADAGEPMELDRMKLSGAERKRRTDNNLCMACGEGGHFARDHHREIDPIPMPRRNPQASNRSRGRGSYPQSNNQTPGYGRGPYNPPQHNQAPGQPWQHWMPVPFNQPQFMTPQLRAMQQGSVLGETSSETTSTTGDDSFSQNTATATDSQLKGTPLA